MPKTTKKVTKGFEKKKLDDLNDEITKYWDEYELDQIGVDNDPGIDVPLHARGLTSEWNFQKRMPWYDKVTWVLTAVNVAILISLVIKNVWQY